MLSGQMEVSHERVLKQTERCPFCCTAGHHNWGNDDLAGGDGKAEGIGYHPQVPRRLIVTSQGPTFPESRRPE